MKFDNFVKYAGSHGVIMKTETGDKWLFYNGVGMLIPEDRTVLGNEVDMPEYMNDLIEFDDFNACELTKAYVPNADSKPSELLRRFENDDLFIDVPNKIFGFIEKCDYTYINICEVNENVTYTALLVSDDYGDEKEFKMIYVVKD